MDWRLLYASAFTVISVVAQNKTRPIVHIVVTESSGVLDNGTTYYVRYLKPLLDIALEDAQSQFGDFIDIRFKHVETLSGPSRIGALAAYEYHTNNVDVFFGPVSNEGVVPLAYMALSWNLPVITPRGNDQLSRNSTIFPNIISLHPFDKFELVKFTAQLCQKYAWRHLTLFIDEDKSVMMTTGDIYKSHFTSLGMKLVSVLMSSQRSTDKELDTFLQESRKSSRVYILLLELKYVRNLLLRASALGMTRSEYLYIVPEIMGGERIDVDVWRRNDSYDLEAQRAFRATLFINVLNPVRSVFDRLLQRLNQRLFDNDTSNYVTASYEDEAGEEYMNQNSQLAQQYILTGYYNAFFIYLNAVNETIAEGGNFTDGLSIAHKMKNRTYLGVAGLFIINQDGHRVTDMSIVDMTNENNGTFERVGYYSVLTGVLSLDDPYRSVWPAESGHVSDIPPCGFLDELCIVSALEKDYRLAIGLSTSFGVLLLVVAIGVIVAFRLRHAQNRQLLNWWKISQEELQPIKSHVSKSTFSTIFRQGNVVRQHYLNDVDVHVTGALLKEFQEIRDINHPNLLRVLGAWLEGDKKMIITEHCPKGSLQEVLMDSKFKLDSVFSLSILSDIVKALSYLHKHPLRVHGRLTSEVCMIDSRFSVKVGFYGLPTIYDYIKLQSQNQSHEKDLLWVAPELLRNRGKPTQQGDVYSLAIIISEMLTREEPYSNDKDYLTTKEVIEKIIVCQDPPFRPAVSAPPELIPVETLMKQCWQENPEKRPSLSMISTALHTLMVKVNKSGGLVDNLLQRLEKYSSNLEKIVDEKVDELRQEKEKSEELLRQMLPASVADRLKAGLTVEPEFYDCVTIYFSDIVGFTEICSMLKPVQIVNLLNDVYSCFDEIIGNYDVYKVETIGDAYMVVSGLPARNGNEHARQIARMSLALLNVVSSFTPLNTCEDQLKLRIGLHSGPVCAGVVGLKMPRYCLFGDAVNTASRMESNGVELKIHMSCTTADILRTFGKFILQKRGALEIKGKGIMETYWLLGEED
ncbi:Nitrogen permease reactivator protein [Bulinus truncatus]|nr:Nitrogen permease reactivator protein [Bulinus truncatus]